MCFTPLKKTYMKVYKTKQYNKKFNRNCSYATLSAIIHIISEGFVDK